MKAASGNPGPTKAIAVHPARGAAASSAPGKTWQQAMPEARMRSGMPEPAVMDRTAQRIRFCTSSDGVRVAYAALGSGPPRRTAADERDGAHGVRGGPGQRRSS